MPLPRPKIMLAADRPPLPSVEDLAKRGLTFERVNPAHENPVRLRQHGHPLGIFPSPARAAALIRQLSLLVIIAGTLLARVPGHAAGEAQTSPAAFLHAVAVVEDWRGREGAAGEVGPWQMMPRTWASYRGTAAERAARHHAWLCAELVRRGVDPSPFNLALCWNAGLARATSGRAPVASYDYARRVVAVMEAKP